jgi:predicted DNA-binding transcriptional regulator AlpA
MSGHYLSEREFSERYLVSQRTAQRMRVTGEGPKWVRLGARKIAYRLSDIEAWTQERTFAHRAQELSERTAA